MPAIWPLLVLRVRVLERRSVVGGAAVTEAFHPGFRNSVASYTVSLLHPNIIADLNLYQHGLRILPRPLANVLPLAEDQYLKVGGGLAATQAEFARFSQRDAERLPDYYTMLESVADVLRSLLLDTPPNVGGGLSDIARGVKLRGHTTQTHYVTAPRCAGFIHLKRCRDAGTLV